MNDIHDPFVTNEFINMLSKYVEIKRIKGIPTINGRTYFWANKKFEDVKKQYVIGGNKTSPKSYFVKYPCNYEETYFNYARDFKNHLKKSKGKLALEIKNNSNNIDGYYEIYRETMKRNNSFIFKKSFIKDILSLSYCKIYEISYENRVIAFSAMLNKNVFMTCSSKEGLKHRPNQFLLDAMYKDNENQFVYLGTSFTNSGHQAFKEHSGAISINCSPMPYTCEFHIAKALLKLPLGPIYRMFSNNKFMVSVFLPF
jgi:hypothetical protein